MLFPTYADYLRKAREWFEALPENSLLEWGSSMVETPHPGVDFVEIRCPVLEASLQLSWIWTIFAPNSPSLSNPEDRWPFIIEDIRSTWSIPEVEEIIGQWIAEQTGRNDVVFRFIPGLRAPFEERVVELATAPASAILAQIKAAQTAAQRAFDGLPYLSKEARSELIFLLQNQPEATLPPSPTP